METFISYAVIAVAILLVVTILMQARGSSSTGLFGGFSTTFRTRRGVERTLFQFTILLGVIFVVLAIANIRIT